MIRVCGNHRIQMANKGKANIGPPRGHHQIVSALIHGLAYHRQTLVFQVTMKKIEDLEFLAGGARDINEPPEKVLEALWLDGRSRVTQDSWNSYMTEIIVPSLCGPPRSRVRVRRIR
jgi:hypothetical protein